MHTLISLIMICGFLQMVLFCLFYESYTKNLTCNKMKSKHISMTVSLWSNRMRATSWIQLSYLSFKYPTKWAQKAPEHTFPHIEKSSLFPVDKITTAFLYYSRLLQDSRLLPYKYSVANIIWNHYNLISLTFFSFSKHIIPANVCPKYFFPVFTCICFVGFFNKNFIKMFICFCVFSSILIFLCIFLR